MMVAVMGVNLLVTRVAGRCQVPRATGPGPLGCSRVSHTYWLALSP